MSKLPHEKIPPELLEVLLNNPHESLILVDAQGIVRYMSTSDEAFYRIPREEAIGRHILELNPDSELPRVLKTGRAEIGRLFRLGEKERIIARIPLRDRDGNVVGAVGKLMFWNPAKVKELVRQVEVLQSLWTTMRRNCNRYTETAIPSREWSVSQRRCRKPSRLQSGLPARTSLS